MKALLTILLLISFSSDIFTQPTIYHVRTDGDDSNTGLSWSEAFATVQKALDSADSLDQIWIAEGTYHPTSDHGLVAEEEGDHIEQERLKHFRMKNGVAIYGGFPSAGNPNMNDRDWENNATILSGDFNNDDEFIEGDYGEWWVRNRGENAYHVFYHPSDLNIDSTAILDGFIITGGNGEYIRDGGGMYNDNSHPIIQNCMFKYNYSISGGGIYNQNSNPIIHNCEFTYNQAESGIGIYNHYSNPIITNSTFYKNFCDIGGGGAIYNRYSDPLIKECKIKENGGEGQYVTVGGILNRNSNPHIIDSIIESNSAGGMANFNSNPIIEGCIIGGNISEYGAGGIFNMNSDPMFKNTLITENYIWGWGVGGVENRDSNPTFINCLIANNSGVEGGGVYNDNSSPIFINCTIAHNQSWDTSRGLGIYNGSGWSGEGEGSHTTIINSIIWGNKHDYYPVSQIYNDDNSTTTLDYSIYSNEPGDIIEGGGFTVTNSLTDDPLFVGSDINTAHPYLIWGNSPAVDAGSNELLPEDIEYDIRGEPRIVAGIGETARVDIGAYEWQPEIDPVKPSISPISVPPHVVGIPFWLEIEVGNPHEITDLFGLSFTLKTDHSECVYVDDSAEAGPFLGSSPIFFSEKVDDQTVDIAVSRTSPPGVNGSGIVARAQFTTSSDLDDQVEVLFNLKNISAIDSEGEDISLHPSTLSITVLPGIIVWPGDTNNDGKVDASDILPIGLYYGQTRPENNNPGMQWQEYLRDPWPADEGNPRRIYADANGDGVIDASDVLAIGLNYGKTHEDSAPARYIAGTSLSKSIDERSGTLDVTVLQDEFDKNEIELGVRLNTLYPLYGISFKLHIDKSDGLADSFVLDVTDGILGEDVLTFNKLIPDEGFIDIGLSLKDGEGYTGEGELLRLTLSHEYCEGSRIHFSLEDITAIDETGKPLKFDGGGALEYRIGQGDVGIPAEYTISQNYPNPFNPVTTMEYGIPQESHVLLVIYDMLGREVTRLVDETQTAGIHNVSWDSSDSRVSSGIYIYRISATSSDGDKKFIESMRMILMK